MTKKIVSTLAGLVLLLAVAPLYAGSILNHEMTVSVPFGFVAGDKFLPDGDYSVQVNQERGTVVLRQEGQSLLMILTIRKQSRSAHSAASLSSSGTAPASFWLRCGVRPMLPARRLPRAPGKKNWHATSNRSRFLWSKLARNLAGRAPASDAGDGIRIARPSNPHSETIEFDSALLRRSK